MGGFGQAFDSAEADTDAGKAAGAADGDDGGEVAQFDVVLGQQIGDPGYERGGVAAAFEFNLAEELDLTIMEAGEGYGAGGAASVDCKQKLAEGGHFCAWRTGFHDLLSMTQREAGVPADRWFHPTG